MPEACEDIIDDIEDMVNSIPGAKSEDNVDKENEERREKLRKGVVYSKNLTKKQKQEREQSVGYDIPGKQTVYLKTYGCSHNVSDSEYMAGQLVDYGYSVTEDFENADVYLINSCTVKNPSQDTFKNLVTKASSTKKPVIVAGCVPQGQPKAVSDNLSVIGVQQIDRVVEVVEESLRGNTVKFLGRSKKQLPGLEIPKIRRNPFIEIIPINVGCLNECTYCKTKHARGNLSSYRPIDIVTRAKSVIENEGVIEVRITSEDTGAYGRDIDTDLPTLLNQIVDVLIDGTMLKVGMTNPPYILEHLEAISQVLNNDRVYNFLHIPVQSGSNKVLESMKRLYTIEEFENVVDFLTEKCPGIMIATDIICGFPDDEDFEETLNLVKKYKFSVLNISQFYPRPGTPAAAMQRVPTEIVKERSRKLTKLFESYKSYDNLVGTTQRVWITERATDKVKLVGHTKDYVQVLIDPEEAEMGSTATVEVISASKWSVVGKVINQDDNKSMLQPIFREAELQNESKLPILQNTEEKENLKDTEIEDTMEVVVESEKKDSLSKYSVLILILAILLGLYQVYTKMLI